MTVMNMWKCKDVCLHIAYTPSWHVAYRQAYTDACTACLILSQVTTGSAQNREISNLVVGKVRDKHWSDTQAVQC
jgi:hypothetical protein